MSIIASAPVPAGSRLIDADTVEIPRPRLAAEPMKPAADVLALGRLVDELMTTTELTAEQIAEQVGTTVAEAFDARNDLICREAGADRLVRASGPCPAWCPTDHTGEVVEVDGFTIGQVHERILAELPAKDPAWLNRAATAVVMVESDTEAGAVVTPARVILAIAEGPEGGHPGEQDCQGWTGTPDQARALAAALLAGAELVEGGVR